MMHALENDAFYSHLLTINIDGKKQQAVLKDLQRHHFKKALHHADFLRVNATDEINMHVPLHFKNEATCPGVKAGGVVSHRQIDVEIRCLANNIPEYIEVDLAHLEMDHSIHLSELKLPKGVSIVALSHGHSENDVAIVSVHLPRRAEEEPTAPTTAETEVAPKGKEAAESKEKGKGSK
jgi:large subunit ribosomal protein L25